MTHLFNDKTGGRLIDSIRFACHLTHFHQQFGHFTGFDSHALSKVRYRDLLGDFDVIDNLFDRFFKLMLT